MNELTIEIVKLVASFSTPLIILILGITINRKLESAKAAFSKEKDWQNWWAGKFLSVCHEYNSIITDIVSELFQLKQIENEKLSGWESKFKEKLGKIHPMLTKLQYLDWEIKNYIQFAPKHGLTVLEKQNMLFKSIVGFTNEKKIDFEEIRKLQFRFNEAIRLAHAEILGLNPNKVPQRKLVNLRH